MTLFLFRFWPALVPLLVYWLWLVAARRRARREGKPVPGFRGRPLYWAILASLAVAAACFLLIGLSHVPEKGAYEPPRLENGNITPGRLRP